ncbi:MAG: PDZ domain-containing protein [Bacteroidia bacterium]
MKNFALLFLFTLFAGQILAQDSPKTVIIRINGDVNGKEIKIDTTLSTGDEVNIILNKLGVNDSFTGKSVEKTIIIRDGKQEGEDHEIRWFSNENFSDSMVFNNGDFKMVFSPDSGNRFTFIDGEKMAEGIKEGFNFNWNSEEDSDRSRAFMGISMSNDESGGVRITGITRDSGAEKAGLRSGDIIIMVGKERIGNDKQLSAIIRSYDPGDKLDVTYIRGGKKQKTTVKLGKRD